MMAVHMHAGDLGAIDAKYDIAVSTAAAALDYIVVDDTRAAQRCVELLRARKLGVATFLLLDKQAHLQQKALEKASPPEGVAQLYRDAKLHPCAVCGVLLVPSKSPMQHKFPIPKPSAYVIASSPCPALTSGKASITHTVVQSQSLIFISVRSSKLRGVSSCRPQATQVAQH